MQQKYHFQLNCGKEVFHIYFLIFSLEKLTQEYYTKVKQKISTD